MANRDDARSRNRALLNRLLDSWYDRLTVVEVHLPGGADARFELPPSEATDPACDDTEPDPPAASAKLSATEAAILEAVLDGASTGQVIAGKAGYPFESVRRYLSEMRRRELLTGSRGDQGYHLTPAGKTAIFEYRERHPDD